MTLKQRALWDVILVLAMGAVGGTVITLAMQYLGTVPVLVVLGVLALAWLAQTAYRIRVSQLEYEAERVRRALEDQR